MVSVIWFQVWFSQVQIGILASHPMQGTQSEFWPRQLLKKWISFQETGDDFNRDSDSNSERFSESEDFEESDGKLTSV